jgi:hypothetical protein
MLDSRSADPNRAAASSPPSAYDSGKRLGRSWEDTHLFSFFLLLSLRAIEESIWRSYVGSPGTDEGKLLTCEASILALRRDPRILKIPPYLSALFIVVGIAWLLVLPLDQYSRRTYVSENALLPGQVHTYFTGSEHDVFRAYRHEVHGLIDKSVEEWAHISTCIHNRADKYIDEPTP